MDNDTPILNADATADADVTSDADVTADAVVVEPGTEATEDTDAADTDPFAEFGGRETVEAAKAIYDATRNEDGVIKLFIEAGRSLGLGLNELEALFGKDVADAAADALDDAAVDPATDPNRPMTFAEFQRLQAEQAAAATQEQATAAARSTVDATFTALGIADHDTRMAVLQMGDKYLTDGALDPAAVKAAVERGAADFKALVEKNAKAYLSGKKEVASTLPKAPSGTGDLGAPAVSEPKSVEEASIRVREQLRKARVQ